MAINENLKFKKNTKLIIEHETHAYYGIRYQGEYYEVSRHDGEIVVQLMSVLNKLITK